MADGTQSSEPIIPTKRIVVESPGVQLTKAELLSAFSQFGDVRKVDVNRTLCFVYYHRVDHALTAIREMNGKVVNGRKLVVSSPTPTKVLWVGQRGRIADPSVLRSQFGKYGLVQGVLVRPEQPNSAFIGFETVEDAKRAFISMQEAIVQDGGQPVHVDFNNTQYFEKEKRYREQKNSSRDSHDAQPPAWNNSRMQEPASSDSTFGNDRLGARKSGEFKQAGDGPQYYHDSDAARGPPPPRNSHFNSSREPEDIRRDIPQRTGSREYTAPFGQGRTNFRRDDRRDDRRGEERRDFRRDERRDTKFDERYEERFDGRRDERHDDRRPLHRFDDFPESDGSRDGRGGNFRKDARKNDYRNSRGYPPQIRGREFGESSPRSSSQPEGGRDRIDFYSPRDGSSQERTVPFHRDEQDRDHREYYHGNDDRRNHDAFENRLPEPPWKSGNSSSSEKDRAERLDEGHLESDMIHKAKHYADLESFLASVDDEEERSDAFPSSQTVVDDSPVKQSQEILSTNATEKTAEKAPEKASDNPPERVPRRQNEPVKPRTEAPFRAESPKKSRLLNLQKKSTRPIPTLSGIKRDREAANVNVDAPGPEQKYPRRIVISAAESHSEHSTESTPAQAAPPSNTPVVGEALEDGSDSFVSFYSRINLFFSRIRWLFEKDPVF
jgi:RNA recognition motif-containing protein